MGTLRHRLSLCCKLRKNFIVGNQRRIWSGNRLNPFLVLHLRVLPRSESRRGLNGKKQNTINPKKPQFSCAVPHVEG